MKKSLIKTVCGTVDRTDDEDTWAMTRLVTEDRKQVWVYVCRNLCGDEVLTNWKAIALGDEVQVYGRWDSLDGEHELFVPERWKVTRRARSVS